MNIIIPINDKAHKRMMKAADALALDIAIYQGGERFRK